MINFEYRIKFTKSAQSTGSSH